MILLDGPTGSELTRRGVDTRGEAWSARAIEGAPDVLADIHAEYTRLGATHVRANTFRTRARTVGADWAALAARAVELARRAQPAVVLGSVGPLFDCYDPAASPGRAAEGEHRALADVLAPIVDGFVCEAFPAPVEAAVAVAACVATGRPTWVAFTAGPSANLLTPAAMRDAAKRARDVGASAVLVNCVAANLTLPYVEAIVGLGIPAGVYANAAEWNGPKRVPDDFAAYAVRFRDAGAEILGACCGTEPAHYAAMVDALRTPR